VVIELHADASRSATDARSLAVVVEVARDHAVLVRVALPFREPRRPRKRRAMGFARERESKVRRSMITAERESRTAKAIRAAMSDRASLPRKRIRTLAVARESRCRAIHRPATLLSRSRAIPFARIRCEAFGFAKEGHTHDA